MIEKINLESNDIDAASLLGRATLVGGSAYGIYKTIKESPSPIEAGFFRQGLGGIEYTSGSAEARIQAEKRGKELLRTGTKGKLTSSPLFERLLAQDYSSSYRKKEFGTIKGLAGELGGGGYLNRSEDLAKRAESLYSKIGGLETEVFYHKGSPVSMVFKDTTLGDFSIPIVGSQSEIMHGENKITSPGFFKKDTMGRYTREVEGLDVHLLREIEKSIPDIEAGKYTVKDLEKRIMKKTTWESSFGRSGGPRKGAAGQLRKDLAVLDPFDLLRKEEKKKVMEHLSKQKGYGGGSSSMASKGVLTTPRSVLSKAPAAEASTSLYQLLRESSFENIKRPGVEWFGDIGSEGLGNIKTYTLSDLVHDGKTITAEESLKSALEKLGYVDKELAQEEVIIGERLSKTKIKNQIYTHNIDVSEGQTSFTKRLMRDIDKAEKISEAMTSGAGMQNLNMDLNKKLRMIEGRELNLNTEIEGLKAERKQASDAIAGLEKNYNNKKISRTDFHRYKGEIISDIKGINKRIDYAKNAKRHVRRAIKDYGVLGLSESGIMERVHTGSNKEWIKNIRIKDGILTIATETEYGLETGSKIFGGLKSTVSEMNIDPRLLAQTIEEERAALTGIKSSYAADDFKNIDAFSLESRVKLKGGVVSPEDAPLAIMQYAENVIEEGDPEKIKRLREIGISEGVFKGTDLEGKGYIEKIRSWHPKGTPVEEIFQNKGALGGAISQTLIAPDVARVQAGTGKAATLSERAAYNVQALGMDEFLSDVLGRRGSGFDPFIQLSEMEKSRAIERDGAKRSFNLKSVKGDLPKIFDPNLENRAAAFAELGEKNILTIDLGQDIGGLKKVNVFAAADMGQYTGEGSMLEGATKSLLAGVSAGNSEEALLKKAKKYREAMNTVETSISENLFKVKNVKHSMYGQAASSLPEMDLVARGYGEAMGMEKGTTAPVTAMLEADIAEKFNRYDKGGGLSYDAVKAAREGTLWGLATREPVEGVHSSVFAPILSAEDMGVDPNAKRGTIWMSGEDTSRSMLRKSLGVDFDKDHISLIAANTEKASAQIEKFYGVGQPGQKGTVMGEAYKESLSRMSAFDIKGQKPIDIQAINDLDLRKIVAESKDLGKDSIGRFSNEFKKIHVGLREGLSGNMTSAKAQSFHLGEDFSHLFVENVLKAKNQNIETLLARETTDALDILSKRAATPYASMDDAGRATALQSVFDRLSYGDIATAQEVRQAGSAGMTPELAQKMQAKSVAAAAKQASAYQKVTSMENVQNVIQAHRAGSEVGELGLYGAEIAKRGFSRKISFAAKAKDKMLAFAKMGNKGLKNIGLWGILPTAAIGLAASLTTKPRVLEPSRSAGAIHERDAEYGNLLGQSSAAKTLFSIPESNVTALDIKGTANMSTNLDSLRSFSANKTNMDMRLSDHRSHMDKFTIEEMMKKGY